MSEEQHIHKKGKEAIVKFKQLPWPEGISLEFGRSAGRGTRGEPDCYVTYQEPNKTVVPVEIKRTKTGTSQVRALDYHVTVVWQPCDDIYWVIPPHELIVYCSNFAGQHGENPFECCNIGRPTDEWGDWKCNPQDVPNRILEAHQAGQEASSLKAIAEQIAEDVRKLAQKHKEDVRRCWGFMGG